MSYKHTGIIYVHTQQYEICIPVHMDTQINLLLPTQIPITFNEAHVILTNKRQPAANIQNHHTHTLVHTHLHPPTHIHTLVHTHTHLDTHTHLYTHTHTQSARQTDIYAQAGRQTYGGREGQERHYMPSTPPGRGLCTVDCWPGLKYPTMTPQAPGCPGWTELCPCLLASQSGNKQPVVFPGCLGWVKIHYAVVYWGHNLEISSLWYFQVV